MSDPATHQLDYVGTAENSGNVIPFPKLFQRDGTVWANSQDVAERFGKQHSHVLRDIRKLLKSLTNPDLDASPERGWFRKVDFLDEKGEERPSFDMTRDGFILLVFGWNGSEFVKARAEYINRFNEMEAALRSMGSPVPPGGGGTLALVEAFDRLGNKLISRLGKQDDALAEIGTRLDSHGNQLIDLRYLVNGIIRRRNPRSETVAESIRVIGLHPFNGRCACCRDTVIVENGIKTRQYDWDHWTDHPWKNAPHEGWAVCRRCNQGVLKTARDSKRKAFELYQDMRREVAEQGGLFDDVRFERKRIAGAA